MSLPILDWICSTHCCIFGGVNTAFHPAEYGMRFCSLGNRLCYHPFLAEDEFAFYHWSFKRIESIGLVLPVAISSIAPLCFYSLFWFQCLGIETYSFLTTATECNGKESSSSLKPMLRILLTLEVSQPLLLKEKTMLNNAESKIKWTFF